MAGIMTPQGITVRQGDSFDIIMNFKSGRRNFDLTECHIKMAVRNDNNEVIFSKDGEIIAAASGTARIKINPDDTNNSVGTYKTDIQLTLKNGDVHTIYPQNLNAVAYFKITPEVTE